jgi:hypothetical protein
VSQPQAEYNLALLAVARRAFPDVDPDEVERALRLAVITLIQMLVQESDERRQEAGPLRPYMDVVVDFVAGGLMGAAEPGRLAPAASVQSQR